MTRSDAPIRHIVLAVDDGSYSWESVDAARNLADQLGAEFHAFHATSDKRSDALTARATAAGVSVKSAVTYPGAEGVARGLVDHRAELDDAVVAITSHARRGLTSTLIGSSAAAVLQMSDDAVLLYGPHHEGSGRLTRVLACVDGSDLSEAILPNAVRWARAAGVPLRLVQVIEPAAAAAVGAADTQYLHNLLVDLDTEGIEISFDDLHDDHPGRSIADYANLEPGTLTALATHGRTGLRSVVMGSVATAVTRHAKGPTLVRRPADQT